MGEEPLPGADASPENRIEIEVTPEMIEAVESMLLWFDREEETERSIARRIAVEVLRLARLAGRAGSNSGS